jgi:hypothetical protein
MQRFRGGIPTQRWNGHIPVPQYMMNQNQMSADSSDSQDSMLTQVPMPYHMGAESFAQQNNAAGQIMYHSQFMSSKIDNVGEFGVMPGASSKPLNPNSSVYVPGGSQHIGSSSQVSPMLSSGYNQEQDGLVYGQNQAAQLNSYNQNLSSQTYHQSLQHMAPYQSSSGTQYAGGGSQYEGSMDGTASQFSPVFVAHEGTYQHSGTSASAMNAYNNQYGVSQSPALGASAFSPGVTFAQPYDAGGSSQFGPPRGHIGGQRGRSGYIQKGRNSPDPNARGQVKISQRGGHGFANGGRPGIGMKVNGEDYRSNLATAPVLAYTDNSRTSYAVNTSGSVQPPALPDPSPTRSRASSRLSQHSHSTADPSSAHPSSHSAQGESIKRGPTPSDQPHPLNLEFSSEPRGLRSDSRNSNDSSTTPQLRSRRKQSTASLSSETPRRNTDAWEVEPTLKSLTLNEKAEEMKRHSNPPKMLNLMAAGGISSSILSPITEIDGTYTSAPPVRSLIDPFGPTPSMNIPYNGTALLAPANSMSNALRTLTANGTRKPTVQEALAPNNLPFIEICRTAKEDTWGVVKIKNVGDISVELGFKLTDI